jgi:nitrogen regulatory protein P-II 1
VKLEVLVDSNDLDKVLELIATSARTGKIGDGKIWSTPVDRLMRIRTGELGDEAL